MILRLPAALFLAFVFSTAQSLEYQVFTTSETSLYANMVLIKGKKNVMLVDAPFSRADAHRVVAAILDTGLNLTKVVVTHDHPDHFFGMDVIADAFPQAEIVANAKVVEEIWRSIPLKLKRWNPVLGTNAPRYVAVPKALPEAHFEFERHRVEVIGPMQGDHRSATAFWLPKEKVLIAGDLTFNHFHVPLFEHVPAQREAWVKSLNRLAKLGAKIVIAGHRRPGISDDNDSILWTREYIERFSRLSTELKTSAEIVAQIKKLYPDTVDVFDGFILRTSAKVGAGEIPPWDE
jgi:glyoxylase-like metal-dependent hydrolase (beta-lactamase superfamily II)